MNTHTPKSNTPLAYLITFHTYGTWLHGDQRESVDRRHNAPGTPRIKPNESLQAWRARHMRGEPFELSIEAREVVQSAIREVCEHRCWQFHAVNVRTNHVHAVIGANADASRVLGDVKRWPTRRLRENGLVSATQRVWTEHGSTRRIWNSDGLAAACDYVNNRQ